YPAMTPESGNPGQHVWNERLDETSRGRRRHISEGIVEGFVGGSGNALSELERELQAAVVHHQLDDRFGVDIRRTVGWDIRVLSRPSQERDQRLSLVDGGAAEKMDEHQRPLPLSDVSEQLLAVLGLHADEVEQVVADLERGAEIEAETCQGVQRRRAGRADQCSDRSGHTVVYQHVFCPISSS